MFNRRVSDADRRRRARRFRVTRDRRESLFDRRNALFERRLRFMDRRQRHDESWMGTRDRRFRNMERRKKTSA